VSTQDNNCPVVPAGFVDLSQAVVVVPPDLSGPEKKAVAMLVEEVEKRAGDRWDRRAWTVAHAWPSSSGPAIVVCPASKIEAIAGPSRYPDAEKLDEGTGVGDNDAPEGYRIRVWSQEGTAPVVFVVGNDARGVLFGVGHLLRTLRLRPGQVALPADLDVTTAPRYPLRGHQLGYRDKTNSYCGWDLAQWEQYIRDLAVFGCNAIELIPPRSDDRLESVHFPLPPIEMMAGMSQLADDYGLDLWIWYPAMDEDYSDPATVAFALDEWGQVFRKLPRIDALFVPGGDPGRTQPRYMMALLEKQTANLRSVHPAAQMWVSPQGFTGDWMDEFLGILREQSPDWLSGVVFGPWVHMTLEAFRAMIPARYPIRNYPDITHNLSCQHPVPDWDMAYALTEGRESINPRPLDMAAIFRREQPPTIGFLTYSEGCNDDVNKCIWSALGWDPEQQVIDILREYSRYYIGEDYADPFAQGLLALERNWRGPVAINAGIYTTLQQFQAMEQAASPRDLKNWRFQQALYRAYYDAHVRSRLLYESGLEEQAMDQLRQAADKGHPTAKGSLVALAEAEQILDRAVNQPISCGPQRSDGWRTRIFQLAEALFQSVHMQLSVPLYRAQREVRGANLDGIDYPLNDRPWLKARFAEIRELQEENERLAAIGALLNWGNPGPGGFYDDLSVPSPQPRTVPGPGYAEDPTFLRSPLRHYPYRKHMPPLRRSWRSYTGALGDAPFEMHYTDLDPEARYAVRVVYSDAEPHVRIRLEARPDETSGEGIEIHPFILKAAPRAPMEFAIPPEATHGGELVLRWHREPGMGRAGRGCEISEIWLIKV
jgi:hypothetical protein